MEETIKLPQVSGVPLDKLENFQPEFRRLFSVYKERSVLLNPEGSSCMDFVEISQGALNGFMHPEKGTVALCENDLRAAWESWMMYRKAQVLNRPPETRPGGPWLERLLDITTRLAIRIAEAEKMASLVAKQTAHKKATEPPRRRRGNCQLRNNEIWTCDGRRVINGGDVDAATFEDNGEKLSSYLATVREELAAERERLRKQKRDAYHAAKGS